MSKLHLRKKGKKEGNQPTTARGATIVCVLLHLCQLLAGHLELLPQVLHHRQRLAFADPRFSHCILGVLLTMHHATKM